MSRREQNRLEKKTRLLSAAIKVFARAGYSGASMNDIAAEAGLTKPTLYYHFPSKEALFAAMMKAPRDRMALALEPQRGKDFVDQLLQFAWSYAETVMHPDFLSLARLIIAEAHRFPEIGRDYQQMGPDKLLSDLMGFLEQQRHRGRLHFEDAELAAEDFWGLILSAPRNRALHVPDAPLGQKELARYVHNGLRTFLRAYSTSAATDLAHLEQAIRRAE